MIQALALQRLGERPLHRRQQGRAILPAVEGAGDAVGTPLVHQGERGDHPRALAIPAARASAAALDPPVQGGAPAQQAIGALDHLAPVLAAHIAPAAEEAGRHAVGRAGG